MESGRVSNCEARNIPHMQLFHHLKQKFPDLRDNDVNESIQKYGLDRERCEEELSQRTQVHPGGYYGPWGRSSPATSRLTSPVRASTPSASSTVVGVLQCPGEYLVYSPVSGGVAAPLFTSPLASPSLSPSPTALLPALASSPMSYGWHPAVANGLRPAPRLPQDGPTRLGDLTQTSRDRSKSRSGTPLTLLTPTSAPVLPNSHDPFAPAVPERRRSAGACPGEVAQGLPATLEGLRLSPLPSHHAMESPAGLAAMAPAITNTTTTITTTTTATFAPLTTTTTATTTTTTTTTSSSSSTITNCTNLSPVDGSSSNGSGSEGSGSGSNSSNSSSSSSSRSSGRPPPALIQEQMARKHRLADELSRQVEEKGRLEAEVEVMIRELQAKEQQRQANADTNTMRIEEVQQENQRLQSECYEMENRIMRLAPDIEPVPYPVLTPPPPSGFPEGPPMHPPPPPQLTRGSSGSSLGSELGTPNTGPPTPIYFPTRPAPPPPTPPPPPVMPNHIYDPYQARGMGDHHHHHHHHQQQQDQVALDESRHKWGCSKCTFINHPYMSMCEMCNFPRFTIGSQEYRGWAVV